jgi:serine/threonine-protein kinase
MNSPAAFMGDLDTLRRLDAACDQFEAEWRNGNRPQIEDYLSLFHDHERKNLLELLQQLQQELILKIGVNAKPRSSSQAPLRSARQQQSRSMTRDSKIRDSESPSPAEMEATVLFDPGSGAPSCDGREVHLLVSTGTDSDLKFTYTEHDTLLVGRSVHAQLRLRNDRQISRHHFRLEMNPPSCFLLDLNSSNGTFVNGVRVKERDLRDGDIVSVGQTKLTVRIPEQTMPQELPKSKAHRQPVVEMAPQALRKPSVKTERPVTPPSSPETPSGPQIPGYQLYEVIGEGELGTVYRAARRADGEPCAVKVLVMDDNQESRAVQVFLREASILAQLNHPHIIRLMEMGQHQGMMFLSTEYFPHLPWAELSAPWSPRKRIRMACGMMLQILGALSYAHKHGMVHRDIKPENLLICRSGGKLVAKLADFGLAKNFANAGMSQMTRNGDVIGSLAFMSPDQFINSRDAKPSSDIYSAGATLYWLITGQPPIVLDNHPSKFLAILEERPTPISAVCPEVPAALCELVQLALEKSPEDRFESASAMQKQLYTIYRRMSESAES